jgi:hypothetical protein
MLQMEAWNVSCHTIMLYDGTVIGKLHIEVIDELQVGVVNELQVGVVNELRIGTQNCKKGTGYSMHTRPVTSELLMLFSRVSSAGQHY